MDHDEVAEERLVAVLVVVAPRGLRSIVRSSSATIVKLLALEPADDLAHEAALDRVRLAENEGAISSGGS